MSTRPTRPRVSPTRSDARNVVRAVLQTPPHFGRHWSQFRSEKTRRIRRAMAERREAISHRYFDPLLEYPSPPVPLPDGLWRHELNVLVLTAYRKTGAQTADTLRVQRHTVYCYRKAIGRKLGCRLTMAKARQIVGLPPIDRRPTRTRVT